MEFDLNTVYSVVFIFAFWWVADRWISYQMKLWDKENVIDAKALIEQHGYSSHLYLPSIGMNDKALSQALCRVSAQGYVILDRDGRLVGKAVPNLKKQNHTSLKLVVDNDKS